MTEEKYRRNIIYQALVEYEENHWDTEGRRWQDTMNILIEQFKGDKD